MFNGLLKYKSISGGKSNGAGVDNAPLAEMISRTITEAIIPDSVTQIGARAFSGCTALQSVTIPDSVTQIGEAAFNGCAALQSVTIPDSVTQIGASAFSGCTALQSFTIPDSVTGEYTYSYGGSPISGCTGLEELVISKNISKIAGPMCYNCKSLKTVTFRGTTQMATSSGAYPFGGCTTITDIYVPWAEGEISGAPWGATNATIHYNHTA